ncbi:MAG TPA: histidine phosphatase family protein, partial [Armatimonadota bacterium]|nr:histidine phosphatase family protein [Armatimonadota bacterium]
FETHALSQDNEHGIATGWLDGQLSERGRALAAEMGVRRRHDGLQAVFTSDLGRAVETAKIAFHQTGIPIFVDWRLRECNYGACNGHRADDLHRDRGRFLDIPYPYGESWRQAVTRWACDHLLSGIPLAELIRADFAWREGWEYRIPTP